MPDPAPQAPFVWPPRRPDAALPSVEVASPGEPPPELPWWSVIEREWLDVTAPPLCERMLEAGWVPDLPVDYCHRCAETLDPEAQETAACPHCRGTRPPWDRIVRLGEYRPPLSDWVHDVKFTRWRRLGHDLGRVLGDALAAQMRAAGIGPGARVLLIPMPTTFRRRFTRGIDHTLVLARGVAARLGARVCRPIARAHRPSQTRVAPSARRDNVAGAVRPKAAWRRPRLAGTDLVVVLDDVTTSGSTLRAACRAVKACQRQERGLGQRGRAAPEAPVWAAVLAKTPHGHHDLGDAIG